MRNAIPPLPDLVPPPGGLARLRHSVEATRRWRIPVWAGYAAAACALAVLAVAVLPGLRQREHARAALVRAVHQAIEPVRPGTLRVVDGSALALRSGQPGVRLYLVQSDRRREGAPLR